MKKAQEQLKSERQPCHTKDKLLGFRKYSGRRDLLNALLEDGKAYTEEQVDQKIQDFLKRKDG